jgi:hypothetical protein
MNKQVLIIYGYLFSGLLLILSILSFNISSFFGLAFLSPALFLFIIVFLFSEKRSLDIIILLIIASEIFYLPIKGISSQDLLVLYTILLNLKILIYKKTTTNTIYKFLILFLILLSFVSAFNAAVEFSQSYINSLLPFRHYIILFLFFPLVDWLDRGYKLNKYLIYISFIAYVLFITQYYLYQSIQFLDIPHFSYRLGSYRLHFQTLTPILGSIVAFNYFIKVRNGLFKWFSLFIYLQGVFFTIFINQTRTYLFGLLISAIVIYLFENVNLRTKYRLLIGFILLAALSFPLYLSSLVELISSSFEEFVNNSGNYGVRRQAIDYYVGLGERHFIIGNGLINLRAGSEALLPGYSRGYFWVDIGVYGLYFIHGVFGIGWYLGILLLYLRKSQILTSTGNSYVLGYALFGIITFTTIGPFYFYLFTTIYCLAITQFIDKRRQVYNSKLVHERDG